MFLIPTQASFFFMRAPSPPTLSRFISALPLLSGGFSDVVVRSYLRSLITPSLSLFFFSYFHSSVSAPSGLSLAQFNLFHFN